MANFKISQLPAATTLTTSDLLPVVQGGVTKQVTPDLLPVSTATTTALAAKAPLASPAFTGTPTIAGTAVAKTSDIATAITNLVGSAPALLDTLAEIDAQLATDEGATAALVTTVGTKTPAMTATTVKTSAYTASANEIVPVDATTATVPIALPTAPADKTRVTVKKIDASTNTVTFTTGGSDVLNKAGGSTTATLALTNQSATVQYAAGIWYVVASDTPLSQLDLRYTTPAQVAGAYVAFKQAAKNPDLLITGSITRDNNGVITTAAVVWPDGTPGTFTTDAIDATSAINGYHITYGSPATKTYTQPTITRNAIGAATNVPQIVVS